MRLISHPFVQAQLADRNSVVEDLDAEAVAFQGFPSCSPPSLVCAVVITCDAALMLTLQSVYPPQEWVLKTNPVVKQLKQAMIEMDKEVEMFFAAY